MDLGFFHKGGGCTHHLRCAGSDSSGLIHFIFLVLFLVLFHPG